MFPYPIESSAHPLAGGWLAVAFLVSAMAAAVFRPHQIAKPGLFRAAVFLFAMSLIVPAVVDSTFAGAVGPTGPTAQMQMMLSGGGAAAGGGGTGLDAVPAVTGGVSRVLFAFAVVALALCLRVGKPADDGDE